MRVEEEDDGLGAVRGCLSALAPSALVWLAIAWMIRRALGHG